jgi:hypothetical protein
MTDQTTETAGWSPGSGPRVLWRDDDEIVNTHPLDELAINPACDWQKPEGLIEHIAKWIVATSRWPSWPMAVAAATSTISAVAANNWFLPTRAALTLYLVIIAPTGASKDKPLKAPGKILKKIGMGDYARSGKFFSVSGFINLLKVQPACFGWCDEISGMLFKRINAQRAGSHETQIRDALCTAWSAGPDEEMQSFNTATEVAIDISNPAFTLLGADTKEAFFSGFSAINVTDGLLNRLLLVAGAYSLKANLGSENPPQLPESIIEGLQALRVGTERGILGNRSANNKDFDFRPPTRHFVPWASDSVQQLFLEHDERTRRLVAGNPGDRNYALIVRLPEYAIRLATLHAMSRDPNQPTVTQCDLEWGFSFAIASSKLLMDGAEHNMAENAYGRDMNDVFNRIRDSGGEGISLRNLKRAFRRFEPVFLNKLTGHLHSLDKIAIDTPKNSRGSGPVRQVFYAMESWAEIDQGD